MAAFNFTDEQATLLVELCTSRVEIIYETVRYDGHDAKPAMSKVELRQLLQRRELYTQIVKVLRSSPDV